MDAFSIPNDCSFLTKYNKQLSFQVLREGINLRQAVLIKTSTYFVFKTSLALFRAFHLETNWAWPQKLWCCPVIFIESSLAQQDHSFKGGKPGIEKICISA